MGICKLKHLRNLFSNSFGYGVIHSFQFPFTFKPFFCVSGLILGLIFGTESFQGNVLFVKLLFAIKQTNIKKDDLPSVLCVVGDRVLSNRGLPRGSFVQEPLPHPQGN